MKPFFVYIVRCRDDSYYIGHTDNLEERIAQHQLGIDKCYTCSRRPISLIFSQDFMTREEALAAERQLKGWTRQKKEALIRGDFLLLKKLAKKILARDDQSFLYALSFDTFCSLCSQNTQDEPFDRLRTGGLG
jgi:predicted GIY-YIG superfamily endonuclease